MLSFLHRITQEIGAAANLDEALATIVGRARGGVALNHRSSYLGFRTFLVL